MIDTARAMDTGPADGASAHPDDRSMRILEWLPSGIALVAAVALALVR